MNKPEKMTNQKRIEFAKQIEYMYEAAHPSWRKVLTFTFLKGMVTGFGVFIGGTIIVGLVLWVLSGLGKIPFLNDLTKSVEDTLQQGQ